MEADWAETHMERSPQEEVEVSGLLGPQAAWPRGPETLAHLHSGTQTLLFQPILSWTKGDKE